MKPHRMLNELLANARRLLALKQRAGDECPELHQPHLTAAVLRRPPKIARLSRSVLWGRKPYDRD